MNTISRGSSLSKDFRLAKKLLSVLLILAFTFKATAQDSTTSVHRIKKGIDIPLATLGVAGTIYGGLLRNSKDHSDSITIVNLNGDGLRPIDRHFIYQDHKLSGKISDYLLGSGFVIPWFLAFDKQVRKDLGRYTVLYFETMGLAGSEYFLTAGLINKYRPYAYNPEVPMWRRMSKHSKNSFFAGHVTITAAGTFFTAQVYNDLHPEDPKRWLMYGMAATLTAANGYCRYRGGFHFFSDILIGTAAGAATGMLVPVIHRIRKDKNRLSFMPFAGEVNGIAINYSFR